MKNWPEIQFIKRKRQKYIRIRVRLEKIIVSAPKRCSKKEMSNFLQEKTEWVNATLFKMKKQVEDLEKRKADNEGKILLRGEWKPLMKANINDSRDRWDFFEKDNRLLYVPPAGVSGYPPENVLLNFYHQCAKQEIPERFYNYSENLPFEFNKVYIRSQKTKWGTCSSKKNISFNWRLIKCPFWIWEYLFIHELCHTIHMNHSKEYWALVNLYYPAYKKARKWIKENGMLIYETP
jgi:predicted metal-dependent hydrolase